MGLEELKQKFKALKSERTQLRRTFTAALNKFNEVVDGEDKNKIQVSFTQLVDKAERLFAVDDAIRAVIHDLDLDEKEIETEFDTTESYRDKYLEARLSADLKRQCDVSEEQESVSSKYRKYVRLPKLEFRKYDGSVKNYINFWAQFKPIHEDVEVKVEHKFQYLIQATVDGSPARQLVESFPPSPENYYKAIELLKQRFGREELLIEYYVRELLNLVLAKQNRAIDEVQSLRELYDSIETKLRSLETLGVTKDKFECMLRPLVESALPDSILIEWERKSNESKNRTLEKLMDFLREEVEGEERLKLSKVFKTEENKSSPSKVVKKNTESSKKLVTAAGLVNVKQQTPSCIFCPGRHCSEDCYKAREFSLEEMLTILRNKGCCFRCLRKGHSKRQCRAFFKCVVCDGRHLALFCPERRKRKENTAEKNQIGGNSLSINNVSHVNYSPILMQTLKVKLKGANDYYARLLIDTGSQRSYVTQRVAKLMGLSPFREERIAHVLFGGEQTEVKVHKCYLVEIGSLINDFSVNLEVLDSESICNAVPTAAVGPWIEEMHQKGITLSDGKTGPIDILIGADVAGHILTGRREVLSSGLVAIETVLGWTLMGRVRGDYSQYMTNICLLIADFHVTDLWKLETLGIVDPAQSKTKKEMLDIAKHNFLEKMRIVEGGRYQISLPWLAEHPPLPNNFNLAEKRLTNVIKKLKVSGLEEAYGEVFKEWAREEIIEEVPFKDWCKGHYLPHRPVIKEGSTTRIRPVFDASARVGGHPALNQCLEKGDNLIELIPNIILRFRTGKIGVVADIRKAFLQISVNPEDRDFLRFLWKEAGSEKSRIFRHKRVVFGVTCSPFCLAAVIKHHISKCEELIEQGKLPYSMTVIKRLQNSFYVDNCVAAISGAEELELFVEQATEIFKMACFDLRGWEYSEPNLTQSVETPVLGLIWDRKFDILKVNFSSFENFDTEVITRRTLLSAAQRIFDPIGILSPANLKPKLLIQKTWIEGGDWDSPVGDDIKGEFLLWSRQVRLLEQVVIPRWLCGIESENSRATLHVFCDASQVAYAAMIFLRIESSDNVVDLYLIAAKARVAPMKKVTIPRLELLAAVIGARMAQGISSDLEKIPIYYWSDSTTVLAWIKRDEPWNVFVWNRVQEIRKLTESNSWRHVPGESNPADLASRGCTPQFFIESRWWEGPSWLKASSDRWPYETAAIDEDDISQERRKTTIAALSVEQRLTSEVLSKYFSKYMQILRMTGWILRFLFNRFSRLERKTGELSNKEIQRAEKLVLRIVQKESFEGIEDKRLRKLKPQLDAEGLIRLRTKIWARKDTMDFRAPYILPAENVIVQRLIYEVHQKNGHIVGQGLLNLLRERFWIIKGRRAVRNIVKQCGICQRYMSKSFDMETPPLPEARVRDASVFEISGVDFAGPFYLSDGGKVWLCLFTCAVYRAVHLDLVTSLSTEAFMMAFRRFIYRRGRPTVMYSDNGTNFRGTYNALNRVDWSKVFLAGSVERIEWRFNPPTAAWWGGFWERLVGLVKTILKKILGRSSLNMEELYTVICECEALINSRPITYVSDDADEPVPITPLMFIQEIQEIGTPDFDAVDADSLNRRLKYMKRLKGELKHRFRVEYLGQLKLKRDGFKNTREPVKGEVVLVGSDDRKRIDWPMAVVEEVILGRDGRCRVLKLRTGEGILFRPVQRVYPLEVQSSEEEVKADCTSKTITKKQETRTDREKKKVREVVQTKQVKTRSGRQISVPFRYRV